MEAEHEKRLEDLRSRRRMDMEPKRTIALSRQRGERECKEYWDKSVLERNARLEREQRQREKEQKQREKEQREFNEKVFREARRMREVEEEEEDRKRKEKAPRTTQ